MSGTAPTRKEVDDLAAEVTKLQTALTNALAAMAPPRASSAVSSNELLHQ